MEKEENITFWKTLVINDNEEHPTEQRILNIFSMATGFLFLVSFVTWIAA